MKWNERSDTPPFLGIFNQHLSFLLEDACSVFRGTADWFLCFKTSVLYRSGLATLSYPPFSSQWAQVSSKKKSLKLRQNAVRSERGKQCMHTERSTNSSASSIKVKTLFGECLSYWLCISLVTWTLCCIGVMHSFIQRVEQQLNERGAGPDFGTQGHLMFKSSVCLLLSASKCFQLLLFFSFSLFFFNSLSLSFFTSCQSIQICVDSLLFYV